LCEPQNIYFLSERDSFLQKESYFVHLAAMGLIDRVDAVRLTGASGRAGEVGRKGKDRAGFCPLSAKKERLRAAKRPAGMNLSQLSKHRLLTSL
jgi:hypothetical protein